MLVGVLSSHKYSCRIKGKASSLFYLHRAVEEELYYVKWSNKSYSRDLDLYFSFCLFLSRPQSFVNDFGMRWAAWFPAGRASEARRQFTCECVTLLINLWC